MQTILCFKPSRRSLLRACTSRPVQLAIGSHFDLLYDLKKKLHKEEMDPTSFCHACALLFKDELLVGICSFYISQGWWKRQKSLRIQYGRQLDLALRCENVTPELRQKLEAWHQILFVNQWNLLDGIPPYTMSDLKAYEEHMAHGGGGGV